MKSLQGHNDEDDKEFDPNSSGQLDLMILSKFIQFHYFADEESTEYEVEDDVVAQLCEQKRKNALHQTTIIFLP